MIISFSTLEHDQCPEDVWAGLQDHLLVCLQPGIKTGVCAVRPFYTGWRIMHISFEVPTERIVLLI